MTAERRVLLTLLPPLQPEVVLEEVDHHCVLLVLCVVTCCGLVRLGRHHSDVGIESEFFRLARTSVLSGCRLGLGVPLVASRVGVVGPGSVLAPGRRTDVSDTSVFKPLWRQKCWADRSASSTSWPALAVAFDAWGPALAVWLDS